MDKPEVTNAEALVNGVRIHYKYAGRGPALMLLHGSPLSSRSWNRLIPHFLQRFTVIVPDLRGHGLSEKPALGYEVHTMAEDIRQLVLLLGLPSISVVGHDLGGIVAYVYAAQHMNEVRRLGILEAPILGVPSPIMDRVLASYWHVGLYGHLRLPELLFQGREREYLSEFVETYSYRKSSMTEEELDEYGAHFASAGGIGGIMGVYRALPASIPAIAELTKVKLTMPVWAAGGEHSMGLGPLEQFQQLAEHVEGGSIPESGHWLIEEQTERLRAALDSFLQ